jgi:SAM-dependent methyltransferase
LIVGAFVRAGRLARHLSYAARGELAQTRSPQLKGSEPMADYDVFAKFYDAVMGDRSEATERLRAFIREAHPRAKTVLELACGTGSVLKQLSERYDVWGLDLSRQMLAIARRKVPHAKLSRQNMVKFQLRESFDVVCCVFDSINHVPAFADWRRLFANVYDHLSAGGVFIFDINSQKKLNRHIAEPAWVHRFGNNFLIMKVTGTRNRRGSNWNLKVFEHAARNRYVLHEENIQEVSFPVPEIVRALKVHFPSVQVIDTERKRPTPESERLYFVCKR